MSGQSIDMRPDHAALVRDILTTHLPKGVRVWAFGSRATWKAKPYSDLDLALEGDGILPGALVADLVEDFRESDLPWKVNVLDLNAIAPSFRDLIDKDRVAFSLSKKVTGEWANHRLADVIELIGGGTPKRSRPDYWGGDIPWISVKDFNDDKRYVCSVEETITEDGLNNSSTKILKPGQIIISVRGTVGALAQIAHPMAFNQSCYGINANTKFTSNDYVFYLLQGIVLNLQNIAHGAVFDTITRDTFQLVDIKLPPLPEQRAIASILGSLDDKIDLNRRMNETLEAMARAIFKDWFVDFGPTHAKMEGREPYLAPEIWELFPERLGEDGLPEGWEHRTIDDDFDVVMGQSPPSSTYNEEGNGLPFFQGRRDFDFRFPNRRVHCSNPTRIATEDWTLLSVRAPVGDINRAWETCAIGRGVAAFIHRSGLASLTYYIGLHLREELASYDSEGTVFGSINQKQFKGLKALTTSSAAASEFDALLTPLDNAIRNNTAESRTLAQTRDLLLPKLMSGEIRVRDAERPVEDTG